MAASDYAQIVFDKNGETVPGCEFTLGRLTIEAYKTWLYIRSKELWQPGEGFSEPTIAQFNEGSIHLFGVSIRGKYVELVSVDDVPYHTVMLWCVTKSPRNEKEIIENYAGICCYAYLSYENFYIKQAGVPDDWYVYTCSSNTHPETGEISEKYYHYAECLPPNIPLGNAPDKEWAAYFAQKRIIDLTPYKDKIGLNSYCGITPDMIKALIDYLRPDFRELAEKIEKNQNITFQNQGDRTYFGGEASKVGDTPVEPTMHKILNNVFPNT